MVYPAHYLLQFGGPRGSSNNELWTCGIRMVGVGGTLDVADVEDYLNDVCVPAVSGWMGRATSKIATITKLDFLKLNRIGPDGHYAETTTVQRFLTTPVTGSTQATGTAGAIPQCSLKLTWETATVNRGLASRGGIYSPSPAVAVDQGSGLFDPALALQAAQSGATLISDLRGDGDAGAMTPNIVSNSGAGVAHRVDRVSVDNRIDIIRKRANSLEPVRSRVDVPA